MPTPRNASLTNGPFNAINAFSLRYLNRRCQAPRTVVTRRVTMKRTSERRKHTKRTLQIDNRPSVSSLSRVVPNIVSRKREVLRFGLKFRFNIQLNGRQARIERILSIRFQSSSKSYSYDKNRLGLWILAQHSTGLIKTVLPFTSMRGDTLAQQ